MRLGQVTLRLIVVLLTLICSVAQAVPRVGVHHGYTRLVLDLPVQTKKSHRVIGDKLVISVQHPLVAERGTVTSPGIRSYQIQDKTVTIGLARAGLRPRVELLSGRQGSRLVVDVPTAQARVGQVAQVQPLAPPAPVPPRPLATSATAPASPSPRPAAPAPSSMPAAQRPQGRPTVVIDAGHGGRDPGMVSAYVIEKDVTLAIALHVRTLLNAKGVNVILTRDTDKHLSANKKTDLDMRSKMAYGGKVSAFVSVHVNAGPSSVQGIETYYFGRPIDGANRTLAVRENGGGSIGQELTKKAGNMAQDMLGDILAQAKLSFSRQLAHKVQAKLIEKTGAVNRGVRTDTFYVIWNTNTAAILTEVGFGSNPQEGRKLADPSYQKRLAEAIAGALLEFLHLR